MTDEPVGSHGIEGGESMAAMITHEPTPPFLTPDHLSLAASTGELEIVAAIFEAGGHPSQVDALGETPLHHAARLGLAGMADWLMNHEAPINARNRDGLTPLELADEYGQSEIVRLLQSRGASAIVRPKLTDTIRFVRFDPVNGGLRSRLLDHFAGLDNLFVPLDRAILRAAALPFYSDTILVAVEDPQRRGMRERFVLVNNPEGQTSSSVLDWTNEPIYDWNERYSIDLASDEVAIVYACFFFCFVRGKLGRFLFVEQVDDFEWTGDATDTDRVRIAPYLKPVQVIERTADFVRLNALVVFKNALFQTDAIFSLRACTLSFPDGHEDAEPKPTTFSIGQGELRNEKLLEENLPVHVPGPPGLFG